MSVGGIRVLILDDSADDAELMCAALRDGGIAFTSRAVDTRDQFITTLEDFNPDIVLSDYSVPAFNGEAALRLVRQTRPEIPVIMVTGALGDQRAVELLKLGAKDYVIKDRLSRLAPAVTRALAEEQGVRLRKAAEKTLLDSLRREQAQSLALAEVSATESLLSGDVEQFARCVTEQAARATGVERANVWLFNDTETELHCIDLYEATPMRHSAGMVLAQEHFKNEFAVLKKSQYVNADDPLTDPRTAGYVETYLKPLNVTSMLDAVVLLSGRHLGLLCLEHVDRSHHWEEDEISFACQLADKIVLAIANRERVQAQQEVARRERYFRKLIEGGADAYFVIDRAGAISYRSPTGKKMTGWDDADVLGQSITRYVMPDCLAAAQAALADTIRNPRDISRIELRMLRKDGTALDVEATAKNHLADPDVKGIVVTAHDISERKAAERVQARLNRALQTLSAGNIALVHSTDETGLLQEMVRIMTEVGGYPIAWIGYVMDDAGQRVEPKACIGIDAEALRQTGLSWGDNERGQEVVGSAIRLGEAQIIRDINADPRFAPWREMVRPAQVCGVLGLPLRLAPGARPIGAIGIGATQADAFDADEVKMLEELAGNLGYGIGNLRAGVEQGKADAKMRILATFPTENPQAVLRLDANGVLLYANPAGNAFLQAWDARVGDLAPVQYLVHARDALASGAIKEEEIALGASIYWITFAPIPEADYINVYAIDITARKHAESNLRGMLISTIEAIAATVESRDPYTAGHQRRVADLAGAIGREIGLSDHAIEGLQFGALIHDLGKVQIPAEILVKPARLSRLEYELIKTHAQAGYDIIKGINFPWPVALMVLQHHERLDGSGYPQGLKGDAIAFEARIVAVADVVEAIASHRPYRQGKGIEQALKEIDDGRGLHFDPQVVDACLRLFREKRFCFEQT